MELNQLDRSLNSDLISQQPFSMISNQNVTDAENQENLLTLRMIESSERKMQLIKKLLTPEEFESIIQMNIDQTNSDDTIKKNSAEHSKSTGPIGGHLMNGNDTFLETNLNNKLMSKSHENIKSSPFFNSSNSNLHKTFANKREALKFFFEDSNEYSPTDESSGVLSIELRSNHYYFNRDIDAQADSIIHEPKFQIMDRIWSFLGLLGISKSIPLTEDEQEFIETYKNLNCSPYNDNKNMLIMRARLSNDGKNQSSKIRSVHGTSIRSESSAVEYTQRGLNMSGFKLDNLNTLNLNDLQDVRGFVHVEHLKNTDVSGIVYPDDTRIIRYNSWVERMLSSKSKPDDSDVNVQLPRHLSKIDSIYRRVFADSELSDRFDETKISRLLNKVEPRFLLSLLNELPDTNQDPYFVLDPYNENFCDNNQDKCKRFSQLTYRWINKMKHIIHFGERSNNLYQTYHKQKNISRTSSLHMISNTTSAIEYIENLRTRAFDYLKDFEIRLDEIVRSHLESKQPGDDGSNLDHIDISSILKEPEISFDFSGTRMALKKLVPKPTARRPLMPQRNMRKFKTKDTFTDLEMRIGNADLEAKVVDTWQKLTNQNSGKTLRLVVNVQQANNIPMRVVYNSQTLNLFNRANPSFRSPSPISFVNLNQLRPSSPSSFLSPPTTYVEVVFQRKQQTTSLVHGAHPSWNETLYFSVNKSTNSGSLIGQNKVQELSSNEPSRSDQSSELIDEYLQLNLYDYKCFTISDDPLDMQEPSMVSIGSSQPMSFMTDTTSLFPETHTRDRTIGASQLVSSRQRVERQLLGTLQVPLVTLLTNGRIEGTFALSQLLFLEDYSYVNDHNINSQLNSTIGQDMTTRSSAKSETYISLFITLDPPVSVPVNMYFPLQTHESEIILEYAKVWEQIVSQHAYQVNRTRNSVQLSSNADRIRSKRKRAPQYRHVKALIILSDARYCIISRILDPIRSPDNLILDDNLETKIKMQALARFVSLMMPVKYGIFNTPLLASSVYFNSKELINKSLGGPEEKAILLCCYFMHLGLCSAVLFGDSIQEGRCVWVIVWHESSRFVDTQLQIQVNDLLDTIGNISGVDKSYLKNSSDSSSIDRSNFISSLPIIINQKTVQLWDPNSGKSHSLNDQIQLISVGSIATCENVYANVQATDVISETNFDVRVRSNWFPLFESVKTQSGRQVNSPSITEMKRIFTKMGWRRRMVNLETIRRSINKPNLSERIFSLPIDWTEFNYEKFSTGQCDELRDSIEKAIKANLLKWRFNRPTYFNRTLSRQLTEKFPKFDKTLSCRSDNSDGQVPDSLEWRLELANTIREEIISSHLSSSGFNNRQIMSWPMNIPFTSLKAILDSLYASGVHNADLVLDSNPNDKRSSNTQFLVSCHVEAYPAHVMSVWLYVAAVVTDTSRKSLDMLKHFGPPLN